MTGWTPSRIDLEYTFVDGYVVLAPVSRRAFAWVETFPPEVTLYGDGVAFLESMWPEVSRILADRGFRVRKERAH